MIQGPGVGGRGSEGSNFKIVVYNEKHYPEYA